jgi:hypothetical protein
VELLTASLGWEAVASTTTSLRTSRPRSSTTRTAARGRSSSGTRIRAGALPALPRDPRAGHRRALPRQGAGPPRALEQRDLCPARGRAALPGARCAQDPGPAVPGAADRRAHAHLSARDGRGRGRRPGPGRRADGPRSGARRARPLGEREDALHGRLLARMRDGGGPSGPDGGSDWNPTPEEARLRRAEART